MPKNCSKIIFIVFGKTVSFNHFYQNLGNGYRLFNHWKRRLERCSAVLFLVKLQAMDRQIALKINFFSEVFYLRSSKFLFCRTTFWSSLYTSDTKQQDLFNESVLIMLCHKHKVKPVSKKMLESSAIVPLLPISTYCIKYILTSNS